MGSIKCFIPSLHNFNTLASCLHVSVFLQNRLQAVSNYRQVHPVCLHIMGSHSVYIKSNNRENF